MTRRPFLATTSSAIRRQNGRSKFTQLLSASWWSRLSTKLAALQTRGAFRPSGSMTRTGCSMRRCHNDREPALTSLKHSLQRLDLVESFVELLLQALYRLLQLKGVILQQDDPLGQLAVAERRAEDPGPDLVCGSAVCHQAISCAG